MTEPPDARAGLRELPLFPLSTVLFPGAQLPLHIFEQRYRRMIRRCLDTRAPEFGVLLIKEGDEVVEGRGGGAAPGRPPEPYSVGTVARIVDAGRFPDGRFLIYCIGQERIRLRRLTQEVPYLIGEVEVVVDEDGSGDHPDRAALADDVRKKATELLETIRDGSPAGEQQQRLQIDAVLRSIPTADSELSFFVPRLLSAASAEERQGLLDTRTIESRLRLEQRLLAREQRHVQRLKRAGNPLRFDTGAGAPSLN
jgi:Lon protease-like protein